MQLIVISGLSGSGKSIALKMLEDSGFYCVDNLPPNLLNQVSDFLNDGGISHAAVSIDVRSRQALNELPRLLSGLKARNIDVRPLFLEATAEVLVKRFSETRRRHPLSVGQLTLTECIQRERELLAGIGDIAQRIDTSELDSNTLRELIRDFVGLDRSRLTLLFQSFAFKNGIPLDADMVFDVRCLPNPYYDPRLQPLSGKDGPVVAFLEKEPQVARMLADIGAYLAHWLPCFIRDNRSYLTVAIGCTGGMHRSVYFVEKLAQRFSESSQVLVRHRDLH